MLSQSGQECPLSAWGLARAGREAGGSRGFWTLKQLGPVAGACIACWEGA